MIGVTLDGQRNNNVAVAGLDHVPDRNGRTLAVSLRVLIRRHVVGMTRDHAKRADARSYCRCL